MQISIPAAVLNILKSINDAGYEAYIVGGCVRDFLLGKEPNDWDITTSAKPKEIKSIFKRTIDTGIQHGTVTVLMDGTGYEVTTYRLDGMYEDGRHPKEVTFTANLQEDLKRRDFTINAMAYHPTSGLVDIFEGQKDLERGIIRCVGNPVERFTEDALRMMRGIRFAAQLGYELEQETKSAICVMAKNLSLVSAERIQVEMTKLLQSNHPELFRLFYETGLTKYFMPEFDEAMETPQNHPHHMYGVGEHILHSLPYISPKKELRLAMLLHDMAKPRMLTVDEDGVTHFYGHPKESSEMAVEILKRLKYDNVTISMVSGLAKYHDRKIEATQKAVRKALAEIGEQFFPALFEVKYADIMAQSDYKRQEKLDKLKALQEVYEEVISLEQCFQIKDLAVAGKDLIEAGVIPGKQMGELLQVMLQDVIENPEHNDKEYLLEKYVKSKDIL